MKHFIFCISLLSCITEPVLAQGVFLTATKQSAYDTALDDLTIAITNHDYTLIKIQPVDLGLRKKGYESADYKVLFFGNSEQVRKVLTSNPEASVLLPLKIILYRKGNTVVASAPSLKMWKDVFGKTLNGMINSWETDTQEILRAFEKQQERKNHGIIAGNSSRSLPAIK